jgi:uncharacterized membrane protein
MRRLTIAVLVFFAIMAAVQAYRWSIWTFGTDTGTFAQIALDAFGGFHDGPEVGTHFQFHWAPILALLYPLVAVTRSGLALQFAQFALVALCAYPLYALVHGYAGKRLAVACGVLPLIYPPLVAVAFGEFHEIAFYPVVALALVWAADRDRWAAFAALAAASALIREDCCVLFIVVGLALVAIAVARRHRAGGGLLVFEPRTPGALALAGLGLAAVNALALAIYFLLIVPRVGTWQPAHFYDYPFAYGPLALVVALLLHPQLIARVVTVAKLGYLLEALAPLAFLPLRSAWSLLAIPGLAGLVLSSDWGAFRMGSHYAAIWIPWLLLGAAAALVSLERSGGARIAMRWFTAVLVICALFFIAIDPLHPLHFLRPIYPHDAVKPLAALVPRDAGLITHDEWFTEIALDHPKATVFPYTPFEYALFADDYPNAYYQTVSRKQLLADLASGRAKEIKRIGRVALYRIEPPRTMRAP